VEVILLDTVPKLGNRGETVRVKPGYARNYLFPRRLALPASEGNQRVFREEEKVLMKRDERARGAALKRAGSMSDVSCTIPVQVGEEDKLYGSVTAVDIYKALKNQGVELERNQIVLEEPIKKLGVYTVDIKLHREVTAPVKVWVVKE
jgi:large subunit ribosomal protein L9